MTTSLGLVELGPDDAAFAAWCGVWAAAETAARPREPFEPAGQFSTWVTRVRAGGPAG